MAATAEYTPTGAYTIQFAAEQHAQLRGALAAGAEILNLDKVTQCDTSGVQLLLSAMATAHDQHKRLQLCQPSPAVSDALRYYGLSTLIDSLCGWRSAA